MEWNNSDKEFTPLESELNNSGENENNTISIVNTYDRQDVLPQEKSSSFENNDKTSTITGKKAKTTINPFRTVTTFVAACAVASAVSPIIDIPILQDLVAPTQTVIEEVVGEAYNFTSVVSTSSVIRVALTITGVDDIKTQDFGLLVVKDGDDNEDFLNSIGKTKIDTCKVSISSANSFTNITTFLSSKAYDDLLPNTSYKVLLLKGINIVKKYSIATSLPTYFDSIYAELYGPGEVKNELRVHYTLSGDFAFCSRLSFKLYDHSGNFIQWIAQDIPAQGDPSFDITGRHNNPPMTHTIYVYYNSSKIIPGLPSEVQEDGQTYYYIYSINIDF